MIYFTFLGETISQLIKIKKDLLTSLKVKDCILSDQNNLIQELREKIKEIEKENEINHNEKILMEKKINSTNDENIEIFEKIERNLVREKKLKIAMSELEIENRRLREELDLDRDTESESESEDGGGSGSVSVSGSDSDSANESGSGSESDSESENENENDIVNSSCDSEESKCSSYKTARNNDDENNIDEKKRIKNISTDLDVGGNESGSTSENEDENRNMKKIDVNKPKKEKHTNDLSLKSEKKEKKIMVKGESVILGIAEITEYGKEKKKKNKQCTKESALNSDKNKNKDRMKDKNKDFNSKKSTENEKNSRKKLQNIPRRELKNAIIFLEKKIAQFVSEKNKKKEIDGEKINFEKNEKVFLLSIEKMKIEMIEMASESKVVRREKEEVEKELIKKEKDTLRTAQTMVRTSTHYLHQHELYLADS